MRADLRRHVRRLLAKYGYPPDLSEDATQLVLKQAELSTSNVKGRSEFGNLKSEIGNLKSPRSPNLPLPRVVDAATLAEIDAALAAGKRPGALFERLELANRFDIRFDQLRYYHRKRRKTAPDSPLSPDSPTAIAGASFASERGAQPFASRAARRNVRQLRDLLTTLHDEFADVEACDVHRCPPRSWPPSPSPPSWLATPPRYPMTAVIKAAPKHRSAGMLCM